MARTFWLVLALGILLPLAANAAADEGADPAKASLEALVKQLDADEFDQRQAASAELLRRGTDAIPALAEAAIWEGPEASNRALDILRKHHESDDVELRKAAREALEKLSECDKPAVARRAAELLKPKPAEEPAPSPLRPLVPGIAPLPAPPLGGIRMEMRAIAGGASRVSVKQVGDSKEIEVVEGDLTINIHEAADKSLKMRVKDGEEVKEYEAKNAEDLKKEHPEAHKLYEKYAGAAGRVRIEARAFAPRIERPIVVRAPSELTGQLDKAKANLAAAVEQLKKADVKDDAERLQRVIDAIVEAQRQLDEVKDKLEP